MIERRILLKFNVFKQIIDKLEPNQIPLKCTIRLNTKFIEFQYSYLNKYILKKHQIYLNTTIITLYLLIFKDIC